MSETMHPDMEPVVSLESLLPDEADIMPPERSELPGISFEVLAYVTLVVLSLVFRLADLDAVPLSDTEAARALPAWHMVFPAAPGTPEPSSSPVTFWLQYASFSTLGASEWTARLPGVIGGIVLSLMPLLFRAYLGRERSFLLSLLLACSPVALVASRTADPSLWMMIFTLAALWAFWRYYETRQKSHLLLTAGFAGALMFLAEPGGLLLVLILLLSAAAALWWTAWSAPQDLALENPGSNVLAQARNLLAEIPGWMCLGAAAITVFLATTLFMFYPAGLSQAGEVVAGFVRGFWMPSQPAAPVGYPVLALLLFDPLLVLFGLAGIMLLVSRERFGLRERFLVAWGVIGLVTLTVYRGGTPGYALWLVMPLAWLAVEAAVELLNYRPVTLFLFDDLVTDDEGNLNQRYAFVKYAIGVVTVALLVMLSVHWQEIGRGLVTLSASLPFNELFNMLMEQPYAMFRYSVIWLIITLLFMVISFMMAASIWGNQNTLQGLGIGAFVFMLASGIGGGWNESVAHAVEPGVLWNTASVSKDALLLRQTLFEVAMRNTRGFPENMDVTILLDEANGIDDDGLLAWLVRDYPRARFVTSLDDARQDEIVLMSPTALDAPPDLGGTYVGQSFLLRTRWTLNDLAATDFPVWFAMRRIRAMELLQTKVVLWLRHDVYDASPVGQVE